MVREPSQREKVFPDLILGNPIKGVLLQKGKNHVLSVIM